MTVLDKHAELQHPQFFISQSEKLSALLKVVVAEASITTDPEACVDYLELTEILTALLEEAQCYGTLTPDQIQAQEKQVRCFVDRIETVQEAVSDWDLRLGTSMKAASRKRARSVDLDEEMMSAFKRRRETDTEQDMVANAACNGPFANVLPSIETSPPPWWTEPFYD